MVRIGTQLVAAGQIAESDLEAALERQREVGGYLGSHLIEAGAISRTDFFDALALNWQLATRDLVRQPPDPSVLAQASPEETAELGWVACDITVDGTVVVATAVHPAEELLTEVREYFPGRPVRLVACTPRDLDWVTLRNRRERAEADVRRSMAHEDLVGPIHHVVLGIGAALFLALTLLVSPTVLAWVVLVSGAVFLTGAVLQSALAISALADELDPVAPVTATRGPHHTALVAGSRRAALGEQAGHHDAELPVYSVLIRVWGGETWLRIVLDHLLRLDYPHARLDVVLLVAENDVETLDAVRRMHPPEWVRVARLAPEDFRDPVAASDYGLALAHGRYVVAYERDEEPDADQLRLAVTAFETDLIDLIDHHPDRAPLAGLRVARRSDVAGPTQFGRMTAMDDALHLDRVVGDRPGSTFAADFCSTHLNMRLLRRLGGFQAVTWQPAETSARPPVRFETLESTSLRPGTPGPLKWVHERSQTAALTLREGGRRIAAAFSRGADRPGIGEGLLVLSMPGMFLAYPILLWTAILTGIESAGLGHSDATTMPLVARAAWLGLGETLLVLGSAAVVAGLVLSRRHGGRAGFDAVLLPLHWLLHSAAVWSAVVALACRRTVPGRALDRR